ncbi:Crp/Fnr family transcriptional regulator [Thioclava sp. GXIMD4216]|uniref:Crp/Fnr family transcriptional regulator n=1 Tax=Thioclava litoralis TaxID=3076557 RepID=A0ABZ1E219_9RHOB|nr:Crp/Fnr family transcriptional regulator [Thioclava sp. FTW29]
MSSATPASPRSGHGTACTDCPLRKKDCFETFSDQEIAFMERFKAGEMSVAAGTTVMLEGAASPQMYTVLEGLGMRYKTLPDGSRQVLNFVFPGDFVGLQTAVMGEMCHGFESSSDMRLCVFDRSAFWDLMRTQPERAFTVTWLAAREEHFLGESLAAIGQREATSRIAWALLQIFLRQIELEPSRSAAPGTERGLKGPTVPMPWKQQDLADALGMSLVHTNKTLARLRREKLAEWKRGWLTLPDPEKLARAQDIILPQKVTRPLL